MSQSPDTRALDRPTRFNLVWRVKTKLPERFGQRCRIRARGAMNSVWVEFADGYQVVTSGFSVRKAA